METFFVCEAQTDVYLFYLSATYTYKDLYMHRYAFMRPPLCASSCS